MGSSWTSPDGAAPPVLNHQDSGLYYDEWPDEVVPKEPKIKHSDDELQRFRTELFETGSEFLRTHHSEIVGIDNVLEEVDNLIHWLRYSDRYLKYNSRLEPGVIFEGRPGTGKTLVSRYIATQSDALFIDIRDFPHNHALLNATDVQVLFDMARAKFQETKRPVVLFWDEFEVQAQERSGNVTPEQQAAISQLTAELDGIHGKHKGVLLIGCTNYAHMIDSALKRSGRMGLKIEFEAPDRQGKKLLLEHYLQDKETVENMDFDNLSYFFQSHDTAAEIEEACVEAWRFAVRRYLKHGEGTEPTLNEQDLVNVFLKRLVGPPVGFLEVPMEARSRISLHEVGHAVAAWVYGIPLRLITVQPGRKALGRCITAEIQEHWATTDELKSHMRVTAGSLTAEKVCELPHTTGGTADIEMLNHMATRLVNELTEGTNTGLINHSVVSSIRAGGPYGPSVCDSEVMDSDRDVRGLVEEAYEDALTTMRLIGEDALWEISNAVNERVTLTGHQFDDVVKSVVEHPAEWYRA